MRQSIETEAGKLHLPPGLPFPLNLFFSSAMINAVFIGLHILHWKSGLVQFRDDDTTRPSYHATPIPHQSVSQPSWRKREKSSRQSGY